MHYLSNYHCGLCGYCRVTEGDGADNSITSVDWPQSAAEHKATPAVGSTRSAGQNSLFHRACMCDQPLHRIRLLWPEEEVYGAGINKYE